MDFVPHAHMIIFHSKQALWHLKSFKDQLASESHVHSSVSGTLSADICTICSLKSLYANFAFGDDSYLPPDMVRTSLTRVYEGEHLFKEGMMDDAWYIYYRIPVLFSTALKML